MNDDLLPSPQQIIIAHGEIEEAYDMKYRGVRVAAPKLKLREILEAVRGYDGVYLRAACLLRKVLTAHLFEDGNKRTAWSITRQYLEKHGLQPAQRREVVVATSSGVFVATMSTRSQFGLQPERSTVRA